MRGMGYTPREPKKMKPAPGQNAVGLQEALYHEKWAADLIALGLTKEAVTRCYLLCTVQHRAAGGLLPLRHYMETAFTNARQGQETRQMGYNAGPPPRELHCEVTERGPDGRTIRRRMMASDFRSPQKSPDEIAQEAFLRLAPDLARRTAAELEERLLPDEGRAPPSEHPFRGDLPSHEARCQVLERELVEAYACRDQHAALVLPGGCGAPDRRGQELRRLLQKRSCGPGLLKRTWYRIRAWLHRLSTTEDGSTR